ncbi:MAG TPA: class I SAM-dependent methyltransferase [Thermoguttaceae bacterium]|nr:class I SAM-dependent methyltransferase [Thermoguttaceae bacterium]HUX01446.1 class I SAM-dependent methyltransferase [Phycisphaerae bacterium]
MRTKFAKDWWIGVLPEFGGSGAEHVAQFAKTKMGPKWLKDGRRQRIESQIRWLMPELLDGRRCRVLDVGCGTGGHLSAIRWLGHDVAGTDRKGSHFRTLNEHLGVDIPEFTIGTDEHLPFADAAFDLVYSIEVLIRRSLTPAAIQSAMAEMGRVSKPGGAIVTGWWDRDVRAPWRAEYVPAGFTAEQIEWKYKGTEAYFFVRCRKDS